MNTPTATTVLVAAGLVALGASVTDARAQQIECSSPVRNVAAVTNPAGHVITTRYQFDTPNLQPLLATTIESGDGCLVAHLSDFFTNIAKGTHLVEVLGTAGSGIDPANRPTATHLVLTLEYR